MRTHTKAVDPLVSPRHITGVRVRGADRTEEELRAELVIDASGRASRAPLWRARLGTTGLTEDRVDGLVHANRFFRTPVPTHN